MQELVRSTKPCSRPMSRRVHSTNTHGSINPSNHMLWYTWGSHPTALVRQPVTGSPIETL